MVKGVSSVTVESLKAAVLRGVAAFTSGPAAAAETAAQVMKLHARNTWTKTFRLFVGHSGQELRNSCELAFAAERPLGGQCQNDALKPSVLTVAWRLMQPIRVFARVRPASRREREMTPAPFEPQVVADRGAKSVISRCHNHRVSVSEGRPAGHPVSGSQPVRNTSYQLDDVFDASSTQQVCTLSRTSHRHWFLPTQFSWAHFTTVSHLVRADMAVLFAGRLPDLRCTAGKKCRVAETRWHFYVLRPNCSGAKLHNARSK